MKRFLFRWAINAVALYAAIQIVPGIEAQTTHWTALFGLALIFGFLNALLRPLLTLMTCPMILLTLGLFTLVINTLMFYLAGTIGRSFGIGFYVNGFWPAFFGSIITSLVSMVLSVVFKEELKKGSKRSHIEQ
jgi:putative membrane protein